MRILVLGGAIGGHYGARLISLQHSFADNTGRHEEKVICLTRCTTPAGTPGHSFRSGFNAPPHAITWSSMALTDIS
jgi:hypothetical protein